MGSDPEQGPSVDSEVCMCVSVCVCVCIVWEVGVKGSKVHTTILPTVKSHF